MGEAERAVRKYETSLWDAFGKYEARTREAVDLYRRSAHKSIVNYRAYVMREYEGSKESSPRLIGPTRREKEPPPEELEFFADSPDHIDHSMNRNGLRPKLDAVFQEAIARAKGAR